MLKIRLLIFMLLSFSVFLSAFAQEITPIYKLHQNNPGGEPLLTGSIMVQGTITSVGSALLASDSHEFFLQDSSGGILIHYVQNIEVGDSLEISGEIFQHQGMTAIQATGMKFFGYGMLPAPVIIGCGPVAKSFAANSDETHESRLIQINDVTIRNTNPYNTLLDNTGACQLYLDPRFNIPTPSGKFSIIGIIIQRDENTPFTSQYLIMPRSYDDIIYDSAPRIVRFPIETQILPNQVTIGWETNSESSSVIKYGQSSALELGKQGDSTAVRFHQIVLKNLQPSTIYHCRVISSNGFGAIQSSALIFSTASRPESMGLINVYFNKSVDTKIATQQKAQGNVYLSTKLINRIDNAAFSIDATVYNFSLGEIGSALIRARQRGISVRIITDQENNTSEIQRLLRNGIPVIFDDFGSNDGTYRMHNKFAVFDARDFTQASDDWVWTGSYNFTYSGTTKNAENVVEIQDEALARCFTVEFNEMWGSSTNKPDSNAARFGSRKANNTPHLFNINGITVRQYFSPSDQLVNQILPIIESANHSLAFCIYDFTQPAVEQKMRIQREQNMNFKVRGVFDYKNSSHEENLYKKYKNFGGTGWQPPADVWTWRKSDLLHHKYLIADADFPTSAPAVVTGSYNWTITAERENDENILIIHDANIANQFLQEFNARYFESGGTNSVRQQNVLPDACFLHQNFPNPFNGTTQIRYQINQATQVTIKIYNLAGQEVKTLVSEDKKTGDYLVDWTGTDFSGQPVSSGVYIYQLKTSDIIQNRKLLIIK